MFSKIQDCVPSSMMSTASAPLAQSIHLPTLPLSAEDYQTYVAFLSQFCEDVSPDNHMIYLVKTAFDHCLETLQEEELLALAENEDMYLNFIVYCTYKACQLCDDQELDTHKSELLQHYEATDDETLFIDKIQLIIDNSIPHQTSPFTYLNTHSPDFSSKVHAKLTDILKFIIGDSVTYLLPPQQIFGLCLKWTLDQYHINSTYMNQVVEGLIDLHSPDTQQKLTHINGIVKEVTNMNNE